jgi:hypothetical protein
MVWRGIKPHSQKRWGFFILIAAQGIKVKGFVGEIH